MRMGRFWGRKDQREDPADLGALVERLQEVVAQAGEQLHRDGVQVIEKLQDGLHALENPDLYDAAKENPTVGAALTRINEDARARIEWLQGVAEARRGSVERSRDTLAGLLETATRKRS
jgi:hypothetical protein